MPSVGYAVLVIAFGLDLAVGMIGSFDVVGAHYKTPKLAKIPPIAESLEPIAVVINVISVGPVAKQDVLAVDRPKRLQEVPHSLKAIPLKTLPEMHLTT